jgi:glycosyltransferase involved in cell wall biosynthesis
MNGISFIVRVRNEEKNIEECIRSLFNLTIPHEINIILHCCTDNTESIVKRLSEENSNINIYKYDKKLSRAGYENLATDATSDHSFVKYSNYCFKTGKYCWLFKWDADFIASPELIKFFNSKSWVYENAYYIINYKMKNTSSAEIYLFCPFLHYTKHLFWEVIVYNGNSSRYVLDNSCFLYHKSELDSIKSYWFDEPWYITEDSDEARVVKKRIEQLTQDFGKEPTGMARALNPECDKFCINILNSKPDYINMYK